MGPVQISYPSVEFKNQLRDGVAPIEACAFNAPRREFIAVDASALRVWGLKRVIKTIMAPSKVRYAQGLYCNTAQFHSIAVKLARSTKYVKVWRTKAIVHFREGSLSYPKFSH